MQNTRHTEILKILKKDGRATVKQLSQSQFVSEMTIRRDLEELEKGGYVRRYHGGAIYAGNSRQPIKSRKYLHLTQKEEILKHARKYLHNSMNVFIDSSSTCMYIIPLLAEYENIKIITNSVQNLLTAAKYHIPCIIAGGNYFETDMCCVGEGTESFLRKFNADVAFLSSAAFADDGTISDHDEGQTAVRKVMLEQAEKKVFYFDKEKLHKKMLYTLCKSEEADEVVLI